MNELEYLQALEAACPGADAEFLLLHTKQRSEISVAKDAWYGRLATENAELRQRLSDSENPPRVGSEISIFGGHLNCDTQLLQTN